MSKPLLEIEDLCVSFETAADGETQAVRSLSLAVPEGGALGIVGESGSGKSVAMLTVLGLTRREGASVSGAIRFEGRDLLGASEEELRAVRGGHIGMVFQDPLASLHPFYRVGAQIAEAVGAHRTVAAGEARARTLELLGLVGIPDPQARIGDYPHEWSGGMRQRAMIAMALAGEPRLLIADEPTSALDVTVQAQVLELLARLRAQLGMALVLISHDLGVVAQVADEVAVMRDGRVVEAGAREAVLEAPRHAYTKTLLRSVPRLDGAAPVPGDAAADDATLLEARDLVKHFELTEGVIFRRTLGVVRAVRGVSFDVRRGETLALVGETGCGKSTTARMLLALLAPTSGVVRFEGEDVATARGARLKALRRRMQMVFQDPYSSLNPRKTVGSIIGEPFAIHGLLESRAERRRAVGELMERVGLKPEHYNRHPHEFSGGERQRIGIARALALEPQLIVADEPVSALDVSIQAQVLDLMRDLQRSEGIAFLLISHDLGVVRQMADRVAVMRAGEIVELAAADELFARPRHEYTRALLDAVPALPGQPPPGGASSSSSSSSSSPSSS